MAARFKKVTTVKHTKEHNKKHSIRHRKIPKISPGAYIFQRPFLRGLFLEGLIYGGKFSLHNRLSWPYSCREIYHFCFVLLFTWGQFRGTSSPPGDIFGGAYTWRDLFSAFYDILSKKNLKILNLSKHSSFKLFIEGEFSIDNRYMTKTCQNPMIVSAICHLWY